MENDYKTIFEKYAKKPDEILSFFNTKLAVIELFGIDISKVGYLLKIKDLV
jgi:hypothetical protein